MTGWRRSADRARLRTNSLQTGNFAGNFAISGRQDALLKPEAAVPQRLLTQFPTQTNRENTLKNSEFSSENRQFRKRPFLAHFSCGSSTRSVLALDLQMRSARWWTRTAC